MQSFWIGFEKSDTSQKIKQDDVINKKSTKSTEIKTKTEAKTKRKFVVGDIVAVQGKEALHAAESGIVDGYDEENNLYLVDIGDGVVPAIRKLKEESLRKFASMSQYPSDPKDFKWPCYHVPDRHYKWRPCLK